MLREWIDRIRHSWRSARLWLIVGIGVKRWLVVLIAASAFLGMGLVFLLFVLQSADILPQILYQALTLRFCPCGCVLLPIVVGTIVILLAIVRLSSNLLEPFRPPDKLVAESLCFTGSSIRGVLSQLAAAPVCPACCVVCANTRATSPLLSPWLMMVVAVGACDVNWACCRPVTFATISPPWPVTKPDDTIDAISLWRSGDNQRTKSVAKAMRLVIYCSQR